jgi:hypothetical protein
MENSATKRTLRSTKRQESKYLIFSNLNRRMQNRESAVRSRMRKKYHQDDLEVRIQELEKI